MNLPRRIANRFPRLGLADQHRGSTIDTTVSVGSLTLRSPLMPASGTAGHGVELGAFIDLAQLGAVVVKSLSADPWQGNPSPRVHQVRAGMINSVGLQGPGVVAWAKEELPELRAAQAAIVVSIWGRSVDEYRRAAELVAELPSDVIAVEVNLSCPNLDGGAHLFAHDPVASAEVINACAIVARPMWAKLSPNTDRVLEVADAVIQAGAESLTLTNTMLGMSVDVEHRSFHLGAGGGGVSGPAIHPMIVRIVHNVHQAFPEVPIVAAGGVATLTDIVEFLLVGASAVQVGTANFADPGILASLHTDLTNWCYDHGINNVRELTGGLTS